MKPNQPFGAHLLWPCFRLNKKKTKLIVVVKSVLNTCYIWFGLIDFNGMSTHLVLFYALKLGNKINYVSVIIFLLLIFDDMLTLSRILLHGYIIWYWSGLSLYFWYNFLSLQKDRIQCMLIFSNRSLILFTLKRHFLIWVKVLHSIRKHLTVQSVWHIIHWGCCFCLSIMKCKYLLYLPFEIYWRCVCCY